MKLRKANAIFSLITAILLLCHAVSLAVWMLSRGIIPRPPSIIARSLTAFFVLHAIISVIIMISTHKGRPKVRPYPQLNGGTMFQRISGALLIIFTWLHIAGTIGIMQPPQIVHTIVPPLFFTLVMGHVAISASKAFITLGIGNARFVQRADAAIKGICAATLTADIVGFYLFVC